jgi:hypothetical protein
VFKLSKMLGLLVLVRFDRMRTAGYRSPTGDSSASDGSTHRGTD